MAKKTLILLADSYDQPLEDEPKGNRPLRTKALSKGDKFEPRNQEEYDRLVDIGAALDPSKKREEDLAELERRRQALEAERDQIDAQLQAATPAQDLKGQALDDALTAAGLSTDGSADEKRARLAAHQAEQTQA